jgi:hypothetical protein
LSPQKMGGPGGQARFCLEGCPKGIRMIILLTALVYFVGGEGLAIGHASIYQG